MKTLKDKDDSDLAMLNVKLSTIINKDDNSLFI